MNAKLSRSLIYLKFKSKQDPLSGLHFDFMEKALEVRESSVINYKRASGYYRVDASYHQT